MKGRGEDAVAAWLHQRLDAAALDATVELRLHPQRASDANACPDFLLQVVVRVPLLPGRPLVLRLPVLLEVEACSDLDAALADLERFVERSVDGSGRQPPAIELPFVALTGIGGGKPAPLVRQLPVRFVVVEVAVDALGPRARA